MKKAEALAHFEQTYVQPKLLQKLLQAQDYLLQHRDELAADFQKSLCQICLAIKARQLKGELGKVGFIHYAMLRSAILFRKPQYRIDVYPKEWYFDLDAPECSAYFDADPIFKFLDELEQELDGPRRQYLNRITPVDLEQIKLREAPKFNRLLVSLADYALSYTPLPAQLSEIVKETEFEIRVGEYYDLTEVVYKEDVRNKEAEAIKEWLEDKHENSYVAAVLKNLDLSHGDYAGNDLRRVDFQGSNLAKANFQSCLLSKARFADCQLNQADFSDAILHDADFSGANLQQAVFSGAEGARGITSDLDLNIHSVWGVNFSGANLEGANFRYANLQGANFNQARFNQFTNFDGAQLQQAVFNQAARPYLKLEPQQADVIIWVD